MDRICELEAEIAQLKSKRPKGSRPPVPAEKVAAIKASLAEGISMRKVAKLHGVSAMTVSRIARA